MLSYVPLKNQITFPRIGYVKFKTTLGGVNRQLAGILLMVVLFLGIVGISLTLPSDPSSSSIIQLIRQGPLLLYALLGLIGFSLFGLIMRLGRLYLYAFFAAVIFVFGHIFNWPLPSPFFVLSVPIMAIGAALLIRFIRKFPASGEEADFDF
jgi:hypothetical protein